MEIPFVIVERPLATMEERLNVGLCWRGWELLLRTEVVTGGN